MKTFRIIGFALFAILMGLSACSSGGDEPIEPTPKPEITKSDITIDSSIISNGLSFTNEKGEQSISFSTNENWTLSVASTTSGAAWCTASTTSGTKGNASVKFSVSENTDYDNRSVSVTIKSGTATKTFTITQKSVDALLVTTNKYEVNQEGGTIEIEVKANIDYKMVISEKAKEWIKESSNRSLTTYKHKLDIAMNEEFEKREGEIIFKSGDKVDTVNIYQTGGAIILLSQNEYNVSDKGDTISVDIKSNIEFGVQMPDVDWIVDEASSRGLSSHTLKYVIKANEEYDARSAEIIFFDKNSDLKDTLKITQVQKDAIILSENSYNLKQEGGIVELEMKANVEYEIEISDNAKDWIEESYSRTLNSNRHVFKIHPNEEYDNRMGEILFKSENISQTIQIHQDGGPILKLLKKNYSVNCKGDTILVDVESNLDFVIKMPDVNWIVNYNANRGVSKKSLKYIVKPNNNSEKRNAEIIYYNDMSCVSDTLYISQSPRTNIIMSEKEITTSWVGTSFTVRINENIEFPYNIEIPNDSWVHWTSMTKGYVEFSIDYNNKTNSSRSPSVIFRDKEHDIVDTLKITQKAPGGFLKSYLGRKYGEYYSSLDSLTIDCPINAEDMMLLKSLMENKLEYLDISEARIIYDKYNVPNSHSTYWTFDDVVNNFDYCPKIKHVILPNSAHKIAQEAFIGSKNLEKVVFGTGIHTIGDYAFNNCSNLKNVEFPDNVVILGKYLFSGCKLEYVKLGNKIETIGAYAFKESSLREINIPDNVTIIGEGAFAGCWGLSVKLSQNLEQIDNSAFGGCSILDLTLPDKLITIGDDAFSNNDFVEISIPNSVKSIGKNAFYRCLQLKSVELGNGITKISDGMFSNCSNLESVFISDNITSIGTEAFYGCRKLNNITLTNNITSIGSQAFQDCTTLIDINLQNVRYIDDSAFKNCMSLDKDLKLDNVLSIGQNAFSGCKSLSNVEIGKGIKVISAGAFSGCTNLRQVVLGENVTQIGSGAFSNTIIESLYIYSPNPPKVSGAFDYSWSWGQDSLRILYVPKGTLAAYKSSEWKNYFDGIKERE